MNTTFLLMAKFEAVLLSAEQVGELLHLTAKTIQNRAAAGTFPRPTTDGLWHIDVIAAYIDRARDVPKTSQAA